MMASRGMGDISPSKMPKGVKKARRDDTDFTQYKKGGKVKSKRYEDGGDVKDTATAERDVPQLEKEESKTKFDFSPKGGSLSKQQKMAMGRFSATKQLDDSSSIQGYLDAGVQKSPGQSVRGKISGVGVKYTKTFDTGGKVKSKVNEAGNYTKPELRKRIFNSVKAAAIAGTGAGQWSARKAQLVAKKYKAAGGGYRD
jgi:hypothetical protein